MVVVFSGYNQRAVVAFLRTLVKDQVDFRIIASNPKDTIFLTSYRDKVIYTRTKKALDLDEISEAIMKIRSDMSVGDEKLFIAPSTEFLNRYLVENRSAFEALGCIIPLVEKKLYETISDKYAFAALCAENGIFVPSDVDIDTGFEGKLVAKPKTYFSSDGKVYCPVFIDSPESLEAFLDEHSKDDFSFQKFVEGQSLYLLFYFAKDGEVYSLSQENLVQQSGGKSIVVAETSDIHKDQSITEPYVDLFKSCGFRGLIMVEIRKTDDRYYMIEANPRFWGPSQLFCDADYNLFDCLLYDYGLLNCKPVLGEPIKSEYLWFGGLESDESPVYLSDDTERYSQVISDPEKYDVYCRPDTARIFYKEKLENLYSKSSKHSNYQVFPDCFNGLIDQECLDIHTRYEKERFEYIKKHVDLGGRTVVDIGGNTGFFTFSAEECGASHVDYYEGNAAHAEFVRTAALALGKSDSISVFNDYYTFEASDTYHDVCICLNVLHHLGDDFGSVNDMEEAKNKMLNAINDLAKSNAILVFQLGFNWKGNRYKCLFPHGTKRDLISFLDNCKDSWETLYTGIAEKKNGQVAYEELNDTNIERQDELGEFLNRPIFILKSKVISR